MASQANATFRLELKDLKKDLAQARDLTDREARKMVNKLEAAYKKSEKAAKKAFKAQSKAGKDSFDDIRGVGERTGSFLGGTFGELSELALEFTEDLGKVAGGLGKVQGSALLVGGGATLAAAGTALLVKGLYDVAAAGVEAAERLDEAGKAALIPPAAQARIDDLADAQNALGTAADVASAVLASELAPAIIDLSVSLVSLVDGMDSARTTISPVVEAVSDLYNAFSQIVSLGFADDLYTWASGFGATSDEASDLIDKYKTLSAEALELQHIIEGYQIGALEGEAKLIEASNRRKEGIRELRDAGADAGDFLQAMVLEEERLERELADFRQKEADKEVARAEKVSKAREKAARDAARAETKAHNDAKKIASEAVKFQAGVQKDVEAAYKRHTDTLAAQEQATRSLNRIVADGQMSRLDGMDLLDAQHERELARIEEIASVSQDTDAIDAARREAEIAHLVAAEELETEQAEARKERALEHFDAATEVWGALGDYITEVNAGVLDDARASAEKEVKARKKLADEREQILSDLASAESKEERAALQLKLDAVNADLDAQRKRAREEKKLYKEQFKANKSAQIAQVLVDGAAALVKSAAILGPPVPPNVAGIAGAAVAGLTAATQLATIRKSEPPSFYSGLAPDEGGAVLHRGEGVTSPRATDALGRDLLRDLNETGTGSLDLSPESVSAIVGPLQEQNRILRALLASMAGRSPRTGQRR